MPAIIASSCPLPARPSHRLFSGKRRSCCRNEIGKDPDAEEVISEELDYLIVRDDNCHGSLPDTLKANVGYLRIGLAFSGALIGRLPQRDPSMRPAILFHEAIIEDMHLEIGEFRRDW